MIEKVDGIEKTREYITVTVFPRQSEEEEEIEDEDYIGILDLASTDTMKYLDPTVVNSSCSNYQIKCSVKNMTAQFYVICFAMHLHIIILIVYRFQ